MSEKSDKLRAMLEKEKERRIKLNNRIEILERRIQEEDSAEVNEMVWHQDSESCLTAVTNTIGRIRQKIEDDRAVPVYIRTISNLGYQFMPNISVKKDSL